MKKRRGVKISTSIYACFSYQIIANLANFHILERIMFQSRILCLFLALIIFYVNLYKFPIFSASVWTTQAHPNKQQLHLQILFWKLDVIMLLEQSLLVWWMCSFLFSSEKNGSETVCTHAKQITFVCKFVLGLCQLSCPLYHSKEI